MKRLVICLTAILFALVSCGEKDSSKKSSKTNVEGQWQLMDALFSTKSAVIGDETITVYIEFVKDGSFSMWQQLGEGRFHTYTGTWSLSDNILTGKYSDGKSWGSGYSVSIDGDKLTMESLPDASDVFVYSRCTIPSTL